MLVLIPFCNKVWEDRWILGLNLRLSKTEIATRLNVFTWAARVLTGWKYRTVHLKMENRIIRQNKSLTGECIQKIKFYLIIFDIIQFDLSLCILSDGTKVCLESAFKGRRLSASASVSQAGFSPQNHNSNF